LNENVVVIMEHIKKFKVEIRIDIANNTCPYIRDASNTANSTTVNTNNVYAWFP